MSDDLEESDLLNLPGLKSCPLDAIHLS